MLRLAAPELVLILAVLTQPMSCQIPGGFGFGTNALVRDSAGDYYAGGGAVNVPTTLGAYQPGHISRTCQEYTAQQPCGTGWVAKYGPDGSMIWGTYLGAAIDEGDYVSDIALDSDGSVWLDGHAASPAFPITTDPSTTPFIQTFLAHLSADGSKLLYSTFFANNALVGPLRLAQHGILYFAGNGVSKYDTASGQILYSALSGRRFANSVITQLGEDGTLYLASTVDDPTFPITPGVYSHPSTGANVALLALDPNGNLVFSTLIGGSGDSGVSAMARDGEGNFWLSVAGSADFPLTGNAAQPSPSSAIASSSGGTFSSSWSDSYIVELSPDASTLLYSSFLNAALDVIRIGADGKIYGLGNTSSFNPDGYYPCFPSEFSYVRLSAERPAIEYSTGIPTNPVNGYPMVFDVDTAGNAYLSQFGPNGFSTFTGFSVVNVSAAPHSGPVCMAESASNFETTVAPGLMVSIYGPGVGPNQPTPLVLDSNGRIATQLAGTQVLFDGIPAPILAAAPARVDVMVPFGVATSGNTKVSVLRNGSSVGTLTYPLAPQSLWFFTADRTGQGSPAINQDGTPNSPQNPAKIGETVSLFATGAGAMTPAATDGTIPQSPQSTISNPPSPRSLDCSITYAGDAPGLVEGIVQFNCTVPAIGQPGTVEAYQFSTPASSTEQYTIVYRVYVTQ